MFLLNTFFPNRCLECRRIISGRDLICGLCYQQISFLHHNWSNANIFTEECRLLFPVHHAFALLQFEKEGIARKLIHQLKYNHRADVGALLAGWVTERLHFKNDIPTRIVTVPLHPKKEKLRGYNQLHSFANALSGHYKIPCDHNLLKRNFHKKAQAKKKREQRSVRQDLFSCTQKVSGEHILLIDDVFTTGNTLSTIAWEILEQGKNKVSVLVMALD